MSNAEYALDEMSHAAVAASSVLTSRGMLRAIHALRAAGYAPLADELERNAANAVDAIRAARIVGG